MVGLEFRSWSIDAGKRCMNGMKLFVMTLFQNETLYLCFELGGA